MPAEPQSPTISPREGVRRLREQIEAGEKLLASEPIDDADERFWWNSTTEALAATFGRYNPRYNGIISTHTRHSMLGLTRPTPKQQQESAAKSVRNCLRYLKQYVNELESEATPTQAPNSMPETSLLNTAKDPRSVFLISGRNDEAVTEVTKFLQALGLFVLTFNQVSAETGPNASINEIVTQGVSRAQAVVVLLTPDEYVELSPSLRKQHDKQHEVSRWSPRPNVIYEAGLAMGMNRTSTLFVALGNVELPSDLSGIHIIHLSNEPQQRHYLVGKLKAAGCIIPDRTTTWMSPNTGGNFATCIQPTPTTRSPFASEPAKEPSNGTGPIVVSRPRSGW